MGSQSKAPASRLPQAVASTAAVVCGPALAVLALNASGAVVSPVLLVAIGVALSIAVSNAAAAWWKRRRAPDDLLFGELMLWGWLRRRRFERLLANAERLLGAGPTPGEGSPRLSSSERARLLERLSRGLEARDPYTHGHSRRVARHSAALAKRMGLPGEEVARIRSAAAIHDVGKVETPVEILRKPAALSEQEYEIVKGHAASGARMAAPLGDDQLTWIVRHHHERLDGTGYPDGLAGEEIPLGARIVAVADTFDALTSERPYRSALSHREALALLGAEAAAQFDPDVVRAFRGHYGGNRPVAAWALLVNGARQVVQPLIGRPALGGAAGTAKATAASLATLALGGAALHADDGRRVESKPLVGEPAAERAGTLSQDAAHPRAAAVEDDGRGARRGDGSGASQREPATGGDAVEGSGAAGAGVETGGDSATAPVSEDRTERPPSSPPSRPEPTDPVDDVVGAVEETTDDVADAVDSVKEALPTLPDVDVTLPRPDELGLGGR